MFNQRSRDNYLVLGLPKTGTSALFYAIDQALRERRRTVWHKLLRPRVQRIFEPKPEALPELKSGRTILTKVLWGHFDETALHHYISAGAGGAAFSKRVAIVRDPRDQLISDLLYLPHALLSSQDDLEREPALRQWIQLLEKKEAEPSSMSLMDLTFAQPGRNWDSEQGLAMLGGWHLSYNRFINDPRNGFHRCRYEDFVAGRHDTLSQYLELEVTNDTANPEIPPRLKRSASSGHWRHWLTNQDVELLRPTLNETLAAYGYDASDWALATSPSLNPALGSKYVSNQLNKAMNRIVQPNPPQRP